VILTGGKVGRKQNECILKKKEMTIKSIDLGELSEEYERLTL